MESTEVIVSRVREAGIVGAGGAGFPTHVKLRTPVDWVIANGAECEPLLRVDQQIARLYATKLVRGVLLAKAAVKASRATIALKYKYHTAIDAVRDAIHSSGAEVEIHELQDFYPAGDEFNTVFEVTGRVIPEGGRPPDVGCLVQNIVTLTQIADAVDEGKPVLERPITMAGAVRNPVTFFTSIGTPLDICLEAAGGAAIPDYVVVDGGPMMGKFVNPQSAMVTKRTSGFIVLPADHPYVERRMKKPETHQRIARSACDQCNLCTEFCPRYLLGHRCYPSKVMRTNLSATPIPTDAFTADLCCECGLCSLWACPIPLPVREMMSQMRAALKKHQVPPAFREKNVPSNEFADNRKIPVAALVKRLGLDDYDRPAPLQGLSIAPGRIRLPLAAHAGRPAESLKKPGDRVKAGDVVASVPADAVGALVHSPLTGRVESITGGVMEISC